MKLSFVVLPSQKEVDRGQDWSRKFSLLSSLGYSGVELAIGNPESIDIDAIETAARRCGLEVPAIGTGLAFIEEGLSLSSLDEEVREKVLKRMVDHIDLARRLNGQVIIGLVRGKVDGAPIGSRRWKNSFDKLTESIDRLCDYASKSNTILAIEPINRYETSFLNKTDDVLSFISRFKYSGLKVLLDTFHMNIEEGDFSTPVAKARGLISHIHFADSNRRYPGEGHIDFKRIAKDLKDIGYRGYISGEITLEPGFDECAKEFMTNTKECLKSEELQDSAIYQKRI